MNYEKVFAETVLLGVREETGAKITPKDFGKALDTMGKLTFQIDLGFAFVM